MGSMSDEKLWKKVQEYRKLIEQTIIKLDAEAVAKKYIIGNPPGGEDKRRYYLGYENEFIFDGEYILSYEEFCEVMKKMGYESKSVYSKICGKMVKGWKRKQH